jgi:hypothetical protein
LFARHRWSNGCSPCHRFGDEGVMRAFDTDRISHRRVVGEHECLAAATAQILLTDSQLAQGSFIQPVPR